VQDFRKISIIVDIKAQMKVIAKEVTFRVYPADFATGE
jgi:hypothetical protein